MNELLYICICARCRPTSTFFVVPHPSEACEIAPVSISDLKDHLSAEQKRVNAGISLADLDQKRPVARLYPLPSEIAYIKRKKTVYVYRPLKALVTGDPLDYLAEERGDR